ncbi:unnamed protein product [Rhizoctonia solani]|uniref:Uncharacterized protein n=1 Tax=Rhizoctonia solani TaxID=456999 RepID=A0A8H3DPD0_9AGAM|nr:unnamed protein product [Rhizoctonia solani]
MAESLLADPKIVQMIMEIHAYLQPHIAANNQRFDRFCANINRQFEETTQKLAQQLTESTQNVLDFEKQAFWGERADLSRSLNSTACQDTAKLVPLPLPNGGYPAEGEFPETLGEFMSLEGPGLTALLELYKLPPQDQVIDARNTLASYLNIPL